MWWASSHANDLNINTYLFFKKKRNRTGTLFLKDLEPKQKQYNQKVPVPRV